MGGAVMKRCPTSLLPPGRTGRIVGYGTTNFKLTNSIPSLHPPTTTYRTPILSFPGEHLIQI